MHVARKAVQNSQFNSEPRIEAGFSSAQRLLRRDGFNHVIQAKNISNKSFKVFFVQNFREKARLGIIASKKILPNAVDRNKVKRLVREQFRHHGIKSCKWDIVVMVRHGYTQDTLPPNEKLAALLDKAEYICAQL